MPVIGSIMMAAVCSKCEESEQHDMFRPVGAEVINTCICMAK